MGCGSSQTHHHAGTLSSNSRMNQYTARDPTDLNRVNPRFFMPMVEFGVTGDSKQLQKILSDYKRSNPRSLEEACLSVPVPSLRRAIRRAKRATESLETDLELDERAAIHLLTQQHQFSQELDETLKKNDRRSLEFWFGYFRLLFSAINKLPAFEGTVWHFLPPKTKKRYFKGDERIWWSFVSSALSLETLKSSELFTNDPDAVVFKIDLFNGRSIREFSAYSNDEEIIIIPGTYFRVNDIKPDHGITIIELQQVAAPMYTVELIDYKTPGESIIREYAIQQHYVIGDDQTAIDLNGSLASQSEENLLAQIQLAKNMTSDTEKARILRIILKLKNLSGKVFICLLECVGTMNSPKEAANILLIIANRSTLTSEEYRAVTDATNRLKSDNSKSAVLKALLTHDELTIEQLDPILSSVSLMYSTNEKESVLTALIRNRLLNVEHFPSILDAIGSINGDSQKTNLLCKIAGKLPKDSVDVREAYRRAVDSISPSKKKAAATIAFAPDPPAKDPEPVLEEKQSNDSEAIFELQLQLTKKIISDPEKILVIKTILSKNNLSDEIIRTIVDCVRAMNYSRDANEILMIIARRSVLTSEQHRTVVRAVKNMNSDDFKAAVLLELFKHESETAENLNLILSAVATVYSIDEKEKIFLQLIQNPLLGRTHFPSIIKAIEKINNDGKKRDILCQFASQRLSTDNVHVLEAYMSATNSIHSAKDKRTVSDAFY